MEENNRLLRRFLLVAAVVTAVSSIFLFVVRLKHPTVFDHYYDLNLFTSERDSSYHQTLPFTMTYILNSDESRYVVDVQFPEEPGLTVAASEEDLIGDLGQTAGPYAVRTINCQIIGVPKSTNLQGKTLSSAVLRFNDGSEFKTKIGQIGFYEHVSDRPFFESSSSGSSSDGSRLVTLVAKADLKLLKAESPLLEQIDQSAKITVNDQTLDPTLGLAIQKDRVVRISLESIPQDHIVARYAFYHIHPRLSYEGPDQMKYSIRLEGVVSPWQEYHFLDLYRYIKAKGAL